MLSAHALGGGVNQVPEVGRFGSPADEIFADFFHLRDCRADGATQMWPSQVSEDFPQPTFHPIRAN